VAAAVWRARVFRLFDGKPLDMGLAHVLFVGLVGLVVPYIVVIETGSFDGWVVGRNTLHELVF
jgi:hypothetical protein